jgi:hypothetical protein
MIIGQRSNPWPDMNIIEMVKYNNEIASFVVKVQQPLPVLRFNCTDNAQQIFWWENVE